MASLLSPAVSLVGLLGVVSLAAGETIAHPCAEPKDYQGWVVGKLQIASPFEFFSAAAFGLSGLSDTLLLQHKGGFDAQKYHEGVAFITNAVRSEIPYRFITVRAVVTVDRLENCDPAARTLEVHY